MSRHGVEMAIAILARAVLALIRQEDAARWVRQLEAILRELSGRGEWP